MIFFLKNVTNGSVFYLIKKNQFVVGRKDCDILISNDQSISRKHAIIRIKDGKVTLEDCGSKYNTLYKGEKVVPNVEVQVDIKGVIQFGVINSKYSLEQLTVITTATRLNSSQKTKLKDDLAVLGGLYVESWTSDCTHLTVDEITLTVKILHALMDEKPLVKPAYWSKFAENVTKNLPPPNMDKYNKPLITEALLNKIELKSDPRRKSLFKGKLFVFAKEKNKKQMEEIIRRAQGTSISWEKDPMPLNDIINSPKEFIIIQTPNAIDDPDLNEVIKYFSKQGKRTIPLQEIAMSLVFCSCEKDCNPSFNRVEQVFPTTRPSEPTQNNALVPDTQSQYFSVNAYKEKEDDVQLIIPDTFENNLTMEQLKKERLFSSDKSVCEIVDVEGTSKKSLKRLNDEDPSKEPLKKSKIDKDAEPSCSNQKKSSNTKQERKDNFLSKGTVSQKRNAEKDRTEKLNETRSGIKENPFAFLNKNKKNKVETNSGSKTNNPFKLLKSQITKVHQVSDENPFKLSRGKKKREDDDDMADLSIRKKKKDGDATDRIFSSTRIDNDLNKSVNLSKVSKISYNTVNSLWFSKNSNTDLNDNESVENTLDTEMQNFIDQFRNTVIVEVMTHLPLRPKIIQDNVDGENNSKCKPNFKRFVKIRPLNPQTTIIGKDDFVALEPKDTTGIADSRMQYPFPDDETDQTLRSKKKAPRKFII